MGVQPVVYGKLLKKRQKQQQREESTKPKHNQNKTEKNNNNKYIHTYEATKSYKKQKRRKIPEGKRRKDTYYSGCKIEFQTHSELIAFGIPVMHDDDYDDDDDNPLFSLVLEADSSSVPAIAPILGGSVCLIANAKHVDRGGNDERQRTLSSCSAHEYELSIIMLRHVGARGAVRSKDVSTAPWCRSNGSHGAAVSMSEYNSIRSGLKTIEKCIFMLCKQNKKRRNKREREWRSTPHASSSSLAASSS